MRSKDSFMYREIASLNVAATAESTDASKFPCPDFAIGQGVHWRLGILRIVANWKLFAKLRFFNWKK